MENITRHEADKVSTDRTIAYILDVVQKSKQNQQKSICFVTGVPGAGKTLVGLDVAIKQTYQGKGEPVEGEQAVYVPTELKNFLCLFIRFCLLIIMLLRYTMRSKINIRLF